LDDAKKTFFVEIFRWKARGAEKAHEDPAVMQIWEGMGVHMEKRLGRPEMEFPHVQAVRMRLPRSEREASARQTAALFSAPVHPLRREILMVLNFRGGSMSAR
jgi:hypothetical protein